jgi:pimeloyl-ACP methyl ester carboxylesterase
MVWDSAEAPTPRRTVALQSMAIMGFDRSERLESIGAPTLVVHGTEDPLMPPENGRRLAKLIPGATLDELDGVGHLVPWEAPERTAELVRAAFQVGSSW